MLDYEIVNRYHMLKGAFESLGLEVSITTFGFQLSATYLPKPLIFSSLDDLRTALTVLQAILGMRAMSEEASCQSPTT